MPDSTKERILGVSEQLFFQYGIANVRLQQIADAAEISVGNLAYHFKNKEALVTAAYEDLFTQLSKILSQFITHLELDGFDKQFSALYNFYIQNSFTFNNQWEIERYYPEIQKEWLTTMNKVSLQLKKRIEYNVKQGFFIKEDWKGAYEMLAQNLAILSHCLLPQQMLRGKTLSENMYKRSLWALLIPNLSDKGRQLYEIRIEPIFN